MALAFPGDALARRRSRVSPTPPTPPPLDATFATDDAIADVTGGARAKLTTAIAIASFLPPGPPRVFLARPGAFAAEPSRVSDHALNAILAFDARGAPDDAALNNFIGTAIARRAP